MKHTYTLTLPDGSTETIPQGMHPVWSAGRWCSMNATATVEETALALAKAEREASTATARAAYLRGLMARVLRYDDEGEELKCPHMGASPDWGARWEENKA